MYGCGATTNLRWTISEYLGTSWPWPLFLSQTTHNRRIVKRSHRGNRINETTDSRSECNCRQCTRGFDECSGQHLLHRSAGYHLAWGQRGDPGRRCQAVSTISLGRIAADAGVCVLADLRSARGRRIRCRLMLRGRSPVDENHPLGRCCSVGTGGRDPGGRRSILAQRHRLIRCAPKHGDKK